MKPFALSIFCIFISSFPTVFAQSNTVGNGSTIISPSSQAGNYGINSIPANRQPSFFPTRQFRRGNNPGIGSSFLQTTGPTSESSRAQTPTFTPSPRHDVQMRSPQLESTFLEFTQNPALESFTPALPVLPRSNTLTYPTKASFNPKSNKLDIDNLPSFNTLPSLTDKLQFDSLDSITGQTLRMK